MVRWPGPRNLLIVIARRSNLCRPVVKVPGLNADNFFAPQGCLPDSNEVPLVAASTFWTFVSEKPNPLVASARRSSNLVGHCAAPGVSTVESSPTTR